MELVIGGAYQGKLSYARETFALREEDIYICTPEREPDWSRRCLCRMEEYARFCLRQGRPCAPRLRPDAVVILRDVWCGVVPMDAEDRLWREEAGRLAVALSREAESVTRLFCGLPQRLK